MKSIMSIFVLSIISSSAALAGSKVTLEPGTEMTLKANEETQVACRFEASLPKCKLETCSGSSSYKAVYGDFKDPYCWGELESVLKVLETYRRAGLCK